MLRKAFPVLSVSIFSSMLGVGLIMPLLPLYANNLGASGTELGLLFSGYGIANTVTTPVMGHLSDRWGRKWFLCIGLLLYALLSLGYVWAQSVAQLTLVRLAQGAAGSMILPISTAYVGDISPQGEEGKWMGYSNTAFFSGYGVGPLIGGVISDHFGMNTAFYTMGGLSLLAFFVTVFFLPEIRQRKTVETSYLSFKTMGSSPMVRGLFSFRLVQAIGRGCILTFLPIFAAGAAGLSPSLVGILAAVDLLLMTLLSAPAGRLIADRFDRKAIVIIGSVIYLVFLAMVPFARNFWLLLLLCLPRGIGGASSMAAASALTVVEGRKLGMGTTTAILMMGMSIGLATGPLLGGVISDAAGTSSVFYFGGAAVLLGTAYFAWANRGR